MGVSNRTHSGVTAGDEQFGAGRLVLRQVDRQSPDFSWLHLYDEAGHHVGKLYFTACADCKVGWIGKIAVYLGDQRGTGLGRRLLEMLCEAYPGVVWSTSSQTPSAVGFWRRMAFEHRQPYNATTVPHSCRHQFFATTILDGAVVRAGDEALIKPLRRWLLRAAYTARSTPRPSSFPTHR